MSWNPPATFTVNEVVTASKMNQLLESIQYLKGQGGVIIPENVISPVRNDATSSYTLERTSATARKYGLLIGALGDFGIDDLTAATRRLTISASGQITLGGTTTVSGALATTGILTANGFIASSVTAFGVAQASGGCAFWSGSGISGETEIMPAGAIGRGCTIQHGISNAANNWQVASSPASTVGVYLLNVPAASFNSFGDGTNWAFRLYSTGRLTFIRSAGGNLDVSAFIVYR